MLALEIVERSTQMGLAVGVGINTGKTFIGNFAMDAKPMYTALGAVVNYGAWLEGAGRQKAGNLISISESTQHLLGDRLATMSIVVRVVPKSTGVDEIRVFYELIHGECLSTLPGTRRRAKPLPDPTSRKRLRFLTPWCARLRTTPCCATCTTRLVEDL